jgi:hypothetical protein
VTMAQECRFLLNVLIYSPLLKRNILLGENNN